jgi:hypothetical protein
VLCPNSAQRCLTAGASKHELKIRVARAEHYARGEQKEKESPESLAQFGDRFLRRNRLREAICSAYARKQIDDALTPQNVLALATLLLGLLGVAAAVPTVAVTLAILVIRIGLDDFCKGFPVSEPK